MFIIAYFLYALSQILDMVIYAYILVVVGRAILSWVSPDPYNPIVRFLYNVTEPALMRIRRYIPATAGGIDFTPMILILLLYFLKSFLVPTLARLAVTIGM
jgi:YggT family protein